MAITKNTGTFAPMIRTVATNDRSEVTTSGGKTIYKIDYRFRKDYPNDHIKWCRRNFGERGDGWDFTAGTRHVQITMWSSRLITMYELWMN